MTDKEKIKQEIERRIEQCYRLLAQDLLERERNETNCCLQQYKELLQFINSLTEEPVSEDLEEAAAKYAYNEFPSIGIPNTVIELAFKAGAEWQREKDKQLVGATQKISHQHGYDEGRLDMKEEILSKAVSEATLIDWYISSIDETIPPIWTEAHINELYKDFYLIPKEALQ